MPGTATSVNYSATRYEAGIPASVEDALVVEEILSIAVNGSPYTITMRTPGFEEEHTRGILLTENVYTDRGADPAFSISARNEQGYITAVHVDIPANLLQPGIAQQRNLLSVSSCGMCGKYEMALDLDGTLAPGGQLNASLVKPMFDEMAVHQHNFTQTGGCHAAALFDIHGQYLDSKEDIGRHNAVDKVIGSLLMQHRLDQASVLLVSGRVSYEIVNKAFRAGIPILCSVSAPSTMAVDYCRQAGITLLAFCRKDKFTVYTHEERLAR